MPGPGAHGGWTARIVHGTVITGIDDARSAKLYSFKRCSFHPVLNAQGKRYTFSISGYTGPGTGVACLARSGGYWLFGEQATRRSDNNWGVQRTHIIVATDGCSAKNGVVQSVGRDLPYTDQRVQTAFGSSCGLITRVHNSGN